MKRYQAHKSSLFLMELIIAIIFFALASSVCLQLFVKSHLLSKETQELNTAANLCASAAETIRQCSGSDDRFLELMPQLTQLDPHTLEAYYDQDWNTCSNETSSYRMEITLDTQDSMASARIRLLSVKKEELIYELPVQVHIPYTYDGKDGEE